MSTPKAEFILHGPEGAPVCDFVQGEQISLPVSIVIAGAPMSDSEDENGMPLVKCHA